MENNPPTLRSAVIRATVLLICCGTILLPTRSAAEESVPFEYQVKAAFLFNFAKFVEWPNTDAESPLIFGILGENPFGNALDLIVANKTVGKRPLKIERFASVDQLKQAPRCQVLFISQSEKDRLGQVLAELNGSGILTVGDSEEFLQAGGIIRFVVEKNKIRYDIALDSAKRSNLKISSELLKLAHSVETQAQKGGN